MTSQDRIEAIDVNPLHWLGTAASAAVGDVWQSAMTALWSAALWLLQLTFAVIDAFTTPNFSAGGPMSLVLPTTLFLGAALAAIVMFTQLTVGLVRRDGQSIARVFIGIGQFAFVWLSYLGVAAVLVAAAAGLERGILAQMLHVDAFSGIDLSSSWPNKLTDATTATVLGIMSLFIVIPAAFTYVVIMIVRDASLIILVATAPISAAGLMSDVGKSWFWKTLRWFIASLLIAPLTALVLGIGVQLARGVITTPGAAHLNAAQSVGEAVVGCIVIAIGACCPLVLFRLLAFVEPGTASGAALRQSWSDAGGASGIMSGGSQSQGSSAATQSGSDGRSAGESGAETQTQSRLSSALGPVGTGLQVATSIAHRAADLGSDILGQAGVGSPGYSMTPTDERSSRSSGRGGPSDGGSSASGSNTDGGTDAGSTGGGAPTPEPPPLSTPGAGGGGLPGGGPPGGGGMPAGTGSAGAGGAGAAGGSEAAVAVAAL